MESSQINSETKLTISLMIGVLMGAVDSTIVLLALPTITTDLRAPLSGSIWIIMVYLLMLAVGTTQLGRLGDILTRKRIFNAGLALFTVSSALCGLSPDVDYLIGFRVFQGIGAAMIQANSGAIVAENFPPDKRGRIYGYISVGYNAGAMLGIILGGIITTFVGWRFIFYINVPIGLFAVYFGVRNIRKWPAKKTRLDVPGAFLLLASLSLISYAAVDLTTHGVLLSDKTELIAGALLLAAFVFVETRVMSPLFPLRIMRIRVLSFSILASFLQSLGFLAVTFVIIMYLQGVRGLSPFLSSVLLLPGYLVGSVLGPYFGKLADRIGSRIPATLGIVIMMIAIAIYSTFTTTTDVLLVSVGSFFTGTGSSMFYPANNSAVMANSPKDLYGLASGFLRTMANIGMLGSFTLSVSVLSLTISRELAFRVFAGVGEIIGNISSSFMTGVRASLYISLIILAVAALFSSLRGQETRSAVAEA